MVRSVTGAIILVCKSGLSFFSVKLERHPLTHNCYEAVLGLVVNGYQGEKALYTLTVEQAGVFLLQHLSDKAMLTILNGYCMNMLYPYACEKVNSLITQAGFEPLFLAPRNFEEMYQHVQEEERSSVAKTSQHTVILH